MRKKSVAVVLILGILVLSAGPAYSGWGPKKFGPIIIEHPAHPWGESSHNNNGTYAPPSYRPGAGAGYQGLIIVPVFTNFTVQFYFKYIIKKQKDGQTFIRLNGRSE